MPGRKRGCGCLGVVMFVVLIAGAYLIITHLNPDADFGAFIGEWGEKIQAAWRAAWGILTAQGG